MYWQIEEALVNLKSNVVVMRHVQYSSQAAAEAGEVPTASVMLTGVNLATRPEAKERLGQALLDACIVCAVPPSPPIPVIPPPIDDDLPASVRV